MKYVFTFLTISFLAYSGLSARHTMSESSMSLNVTKIRSPLLEQQQTQSKMSASSRHFGFIFKYGHAGKNILNTFLGTYTLDLVKCDTTVALTLNQSQLDSVLAMMIKIRFFEFEEIDAVEVHRHRCWKYYRYEVHLDTTTKKIEYYPCDGEFKEKAIHLDTLNNLIIRMIESSPEFKKLPEPSSGYL